MTVRYIRTVGGRVRKGTWESWKYYMIDPTVSIELKNIKVLFIK
jgi:hypothetical protein